MRRVGVRCAPWAALGILAGLAVGAGCTGAAGLFGSVAAVPPSRLAAAGANKIPPMIESPTTTATTAPAVGTSTRPTTRPSLPAPPPPGPLAVDGTAWRGRGDLAFVSEGRLETISSADLSALTGCAKP